MLRFAVVVVYLSILTGAIAASGQDAPPLKVKQQATEKPAFDKNRQPQGKLPSKPHAPTQDSAPLTAVIDREWKAALESAKIPPSPEADDAEFLRRASLDLTGRIPTYPRTVAFLASTDPRKRRDLVDELLASREFGLHFGQRWRNLILPRDTGSAKQQVDRFTPWLAEQFNADRAWSRTVTELLTSDGDLSRDPRSTFFLANSEEFTPKPSLLAASAGRLFLGVQVGCAECHNHPFAEWTQDDFWGLAAFFSRVRKKSKGDASLTEESSEGSDPRSSPPLITLPEGAGKRSGEVVAARFLGGHAPVISIDKPARPALAAWLTSRENPYFARATANRLWAHLFNRGLVHPVDDLRAENKPTHPTLLDALAREFNDSGHDLKHLLRGICNSQAYQRTSTPLAENEADHTLASHMAVKVMTPEVFYESLHVVQNSHPGDVVQRGGKPLTKRNIVTLESRDSFVRYFGRAADVDRGDEFSYGVPELLRLMNAPECNRAPPFLAEMLAAEASSEKLIEAIYLVALSRPPTEIEALRMSRLVGSETTSAEAYAGVLWVLLNSSEFVLNR